MLVVQAETAAEESQSLVKFDEKVEKTGGCHISEAFILNHAVFILPCLDFCVLKLTPWIHTLLRLGRQNQNSWTNKVICVFRFICISAQAIRFLYNESHCSIIDAVSGLLIKTSTCNLCVTYCRTPMYNWRRKILWDVICKFKNERCSCLLSLNLYRERLFTNQVMYMNKVI